MTVSSSTSFVSYAGNGSLTTFAYTFKIFQDSDLLVTLVNDTTGTETTQVLTTNYTVTGAGTASGGNVTFTTAPASGTTVKIRRVLPVTQETDYVANDPFPAEAHEDALDKLTMLVQQEAANSDLAIQFPEGDVGSGLNNILPSAIDRADKIVKFDTEGNVETQPASAIFGGSILGANYINDVFTGDGSRTVYSTSVQAGSKNNIQVYIDGVYQNKSTFSISGTTLTFTEAPPLNSAIEFIIGNAITSVTGDASGMTYNQGGVGAVETTVQAKLQEFVSVKDFGAVGDGVTDDTAAIQAALDCGKKRIHMPEGTYKVTDRIAVPDGVSLTGAGKDITIIDGSSTEPSSFHSHATNISMGKDDVSNSWAALPALASDIAEGDILVEFASAHGLVKGDKFRLEDDTTSSLSGYRTYYQKGAVYQVDLVDSSTVVRVTMPHKYAMTVANTDCYKYTDDGGCNLSDLTLLAYSDQAVLTVGVKMAGQAHASIRNVKVDGPHYIGINVTEGCYDVVIDSCTVLGLPDTAPNDESLQYGIKPGCSTNVRITNNYATAGRHAIDGGAGGSTVIGTTNDVIISNNYTYSLWRSSLSAHGDCLDWVFTNNIGTGFALRGGGHIFSNNIIKVREDTEGENSYMCVQGSELYNPNNTITNNRFVGYDNGSQRGAIIDCGGNAANLDSNTTRDGTILIDGNHMLVKSTIDNEPQQVITFKNRGAAGITINLVVKNNYIESEVNDMFEALYVNVVSGDNIWRVNFTGNHCENIGGCYVTDSLQTVVKSNFIRSAQRYGIRAAGSNVMISNNSLQGVGDVAIYGQGYNKTVIMSNDVRDYHKLTAAGSATQKGAVVGWIEDGGNLVVKDNVAMDAGAFAPTATFQVYTISGTANKIFIAGNVDCDGGSIDNNSLTFSGPEERKIHFIEGTTRHEVDAPSGVLEIDGTVVGTQT